LFPTLLSAAVGGGWNGRGTQGDYFSNPDLSGSPVFSRREVRLHFDWRLGRPVGGSTSEPYASFPNKDFSVRWSGKVIPRFSEIYTLVVDASDGNRIRWRNGSETDWKTLADSWDKATVTHCPIGPLVAGQPVELEISYRQHGESGHCTVRWSSPSTPEEIIDPVAEQGLMLGYNLLADLVKVSTWKNPAKDVPQEVDAHGFAASDAILVMSGEALQGTYLLRIGGKAEVDLTRTHAAFKAGGQTYANVLPAGAGYDPSANVTTAQVRLDVKQGPIEIALRKTSRDGSGKEGTGVSFVQFMRPIEPGSDTPHCADELFYRPGKRCFVEAFTANRYCTRSLCFNTGKWKDRKLPSERRPGMEGWGMGRSDCFENLVMFANETGSDFLMSMSSTADNEYFLKLAKLLRYGSDGKEPYDGPQAHPLYPPLNSNLRVYLEFGNEIWNWASPVTHSMMALMKQEKEARTEDGRIFDYNGKGNYRSWHALRTARASDIFRGVFGDAAMGDTVRFIIEYQYVDAQRTASESFRFLDNWFNNGDGQHVSVPHPVNYYIWGAGGAAYYGRGNASGEREDLVIPDGSFEEIPIPDGAIAAPAGGKWRFSGGAGIVRNLTNAVESFTPGKKTTTAANSAFGWRFTVGQKPIYVYQLGRRYFGNSEGCRLLLLQAEKHAVLLDQQINKLFRFPWPAQGFYYAERTPEPVRLEPRTSYCVLAAEQGKAVVCKGGTAAVPGPDITVDGPVQVASTAGDPASWKTVMGNEKEKGTVMGPVNFLYSTRADAPVSLQLRENAPLQPDNGQQAAVIRGAGKMSVGFTVPKEGDYAVSFRAYAQNHSFSVQVDDKPANPRFQGDCRSDAPSCALGGSSRANPMSERYGSGVFHATAGKHHLSFTCAKAGKDSFVVLDDIHLAGADAIMESGFGSGAAMGQPVENLWKQAQYRDTEICLTFGLARVSYESGWSLGGDVNQISIQNWCKLYDPRGEAVQREAHRIFMASGAFLPFWGVYNYFPFDDPAHATEYPIMRGIVDSGRQLPAESDNGVPIPGTLDKSNMALQWDGAKPLLGTLGQWNAWVVIAPATATYRLHLQTTAGGSVEVEADGRPLAAPAQSGSELMIPVRWIKGPHGVRIRNRGGDFQLDRIAVEPISAR
jgi:hypothetical protein